MARPLVVCLLLSVGIADPLLPATRVPCEIPASIDLTVTPAPTSLIGTSQNDRLGQAFAAGDFNGDGVRDLAILAAATTADNSHPPFVTILFGSSALSGAIDLADYGGIQTIIKAIPGDAGTRATLAAGDFNGDQVGDLALGIPNNSQATNYDGRVYMVFGSAGLPGMTVLLQSPAVATSLFTAPPGSSEWLGSSLATGDMNNDGYDELLVSAPYHWPGGRVYVLYGRESFPVAVSLDTLSTSVTRMIEADPYQACGVGLDCADANADGFDDVLIGSPGDGVECPGTVSMVMGTKVAPATLLLSAATPNVRRFYGENNYDAFGWRVCLADMNGDGLRDPVIAAPLADPLGCEDCGEIYAVYWNSSFPDSVQMSSPGVPITRFVGSGAVQLYGVNMTAGRMNGDMSADLVLRREPDDFIPTDRRSVVIAYGSPVLPDTVFLGVDTTVTRIIAEQPGDYLGLGLMVSDLDGDGLGDVCVGAPWTDALGRIRVGKVHVFYGCPTVSRVPPGETPSFSRLRAYPNPFTSSTSIEFFTPGNERVDLAIYNVLGQQILHVADVSSRAGINTFVWDGNDEKQRAAPSGIYFCQIKSTVGRTTRKVLLVR